MIFVLFKVNKVKQLLSNTSFTDISAYNTKFAALLTGT